MFSLRRQRFWAALFICVLIIGFYSFTPQRSDMWAQISIRYYTWDTLKEVQVTVFDGSKQVLATTKLELSTDYKDGVRQLSGNAGWYTDVAERILTSHDGLIVSIGSPYCEPKEFGINRGDIKSSYDPPRLQFGGHGTGYHGAAMHYRFSRTIDLDCEFATNPRDTSE